MAYRLVDQDEYPHAPTGEMHFNESVYCNGFDQRTGVGGWMRLGNRVNEGYAELSVCLYLPDGRVACQFQRPKIKTNDGFAAGGLTYEVKQALRNVEMSYRGELLVLDDPDLLRDPERMFNRRGARPPPCTSHKRRHRRPMGAFRIRRPRADVRLEFLIGALQSAHRGDRGDQSRRGTFPINGGGWRDHSWGPRLWQNIYFYRLFLANLGHGRGFMLLKITDAGGRVRRLGVLLVDGQYEEVLDMDLMTDWSDHKDPARLQIGVRTAQRTALIEGEILSLAPLRNRRKIEGQTLVSRIAEGHTKFTWDGVVGYGMTEYIERMDGERLVGYPL